MKFTPQKAFRYYPRVVNLRSRAIHLEDALNPGFTICGVELGVNYMYIKSSLITCRQCLHRRESTPKLPTPPPTKNLQRTTIELTDTVSITVYG